MSNTLKVEIKYAYGNELIYPRCEKSILFTRLMGTKTISFENAKLIYKLGFNFEYLYSLYTLSILYKWPRRNGGFEMEFKIKNMTNARGNVNKNQFEAIDHEGNRFFQSYDSIIAKVTSEGKVFLDPNYWDYSNVTAKYRNRFLGEKKQQTLNKINSGEYTLTNLN